MFIPHRVTIYALKQSNLPKRFWKISKEHVAFTEKQFKFMRGYLDTIFDQERGILLTGAERTGKTSAAALILKSALRRDYSARYVRLEELVELYYDRKNENERSYAEFETAQLLAIDDIASRKNQGYETVINSIFRARNNEKLCTIFCASENEDGVDEIEIDYGHSLATSIRTNSFHLQLDYRDDLALSDNPI